MPRLKTMGRFASTVEFYSRYREPYPARFFHNVAKQLALRANETLLDIGCGPGLLTIGFAPFVGHGTGLDPETAMIAAAKAAAAEAGVVLSFVPGRIFSTSGRILICRASSVESPLAPWAKSYNDVRRSWASDKNEAWHRLDERAWFAGSCFGEVGMVSVSESRDVTVADLVGRALSKSSTSPARLGERRTTFESEIIAALEPFAQHGVLQEQIVAHASIFARQCGRSPVSPAESGLRS
jgi:hypothetical protein